MLRPYHTVKMLTVVHCRYKKWNPSNHRQWQYHGGDKNITMMAIISLCWFDIEFGEYFVYIDWLLWWWLFMIVTMYQICIRIRPQWWQCLPAHSLSRILLFQTYTAIISIINFVTSKIAVFSPNLYCNYIDNEFCNIKNCWYFFL